MKATLVGCIFLGLVGLSHGCFAQIQEGSYAGMMQLVPTTMGMDSVAVQLDIIQMNDTVYQLNMTYDSALSKNYTLIIKGDELLLDENNGILLPGIRIANSFIFHYAVNDQQYHSSYEFIDNSNIHFKLSYYKPSSAIQSSENMIQGYKNAGHQYVFLRKIE